VNCRVIAPVACFALRAPLGYFRLIQYAVIHPKRDKHLKIEAGTVVRFHYTLHSEEGKELESSRGSEPSTYLHGANNVIRGLESAMAGREAGDVFSASIPPLEAYGLRNPDKQQRVPVKHLVFKGKLKPGQVVQLNTSEGRKTVTVVKAGRHSADIDTNHPLAGQTMNFDVEIIDLRKASAEELEHRHVHGPGGHHH
jgi:FKBP-type peptidyl-prolyl cis-trans isomerase SlyD